MTVMSDTALQAAPATKARGYWATVGRRISRDKVSMVCALVLVLIFLSALCAPWLGLADPYQGSMIRRLRHIGTPNYPLGTDELGRDMLARLIYGGRLSLIVGILPVIFAFVIGTSLGLIAGYVGGKINTAIMRTVDIFYAFPSVLLAIAISGALGAGIVNSIVSLTIVFVPQITRVAESVTTGVRNMDFVEAARASGAGPGGSGSWAWDWEHMRYLVLPAITTSVIPMGIVTRTVRALTGDILSQDFVEALRAKGLRETHVFRHVIKNAAPTAMAVMGLQLGYMLGGSILIETVFSWPGSGLLLNSAIFQRDLPLLQGTILVLALFFVFLNLLVDIAQAAIDPRIKRS